MGLLVQEIGICRLDLAAEALPFTISFMIFKF